MSDQRKVADGWFAYCDDYVEHHKGDIEMTFCVSEDLIEIDLVEWEAPIEIKANKAHAARMIKVLQAFIDGKPIAEAVMEESP